MRPDDEKPAEIRVACLLILPRRSLTPDEFCRGTRPIHAANCRPDLKSAASVTVAAIALAVIEPIPGIASRRWLIAMPGAEAVHHIRSGAKSAAVRLADCSVLSLADMASTVVQRKRYLISRSHARRDHHFGGLPTPTCSFPKASGEFLTIRSCPYLHVLRGRVGDRHTVT